VDELPGFRIAIEGGDVDEHRVEQRGEFVRTRLQHVEIFLERLNAGVIHLMAHASHQ